MAPGVKTNAEQANFSRASMREMRMVGMDLDQANMQRADLTGSNLYDTWAAGANLEAANLSSADLRGTWLAGARLTHATLTGAYVFGATGLETVTVEWIDIGSKLINNDQNEAPERIFGEEARSWLLALTNQPEV